MNSPKNVLVVCTGNSCRSQIAHGWLNYFTGGTAFIYSAGIETHGVNPMAIATMAEEGIDISKIKGLDGVTTERGGQIPNGYPFYLWNKEEGYKNMGVWIEKAAKKAGK